MKSESQGLIFDKSGAKPLMDIDDSEVRCPHCNKLFFKGKASRDPQEIKCNRCGKLVKIQRLS